MLYIAVRRTFEHVLLTNAHYIRNQRFCILTDQRIISLVWRKTLEYVIILFVKGADTT